MAYDAGSAVASYRLDISQAKQAAAELKSIFAGIAQAQAGAQRGGAAGGVQSLQQQANAAQKAADAALGLARQQANLERASGNTTKAQQILKTALDNTTGASERASLATQTQLARYTNGTGIVDRFKSAIGSLGLGLGVLALGREAVQMAQLGAESEQTRTRFDQLARTVHSTGDEMLTALRKASGGTIKDTALELDAMKASLLGVGQGARELAPLMAIARDRAQQMGISVESAFDSLITGLGRGSALILDNLGVIVKESEVNEAYARSVGKSVAALTEQEKKQALINEVLRQGNETMKTTGGAVEGIATDFQQTGAAAENARDKVGELIAKLLKVPAQVTTKILVNVTSGIGQLADADKKLDEVQQKILKVSDSFTEYKRHLETANEQLAPFGAQVGQLTEQQFAYARSLILSGTSAEEALAKVQKFGDIVQTGALANTDWGVSSGVLIERMIKISSSGEEGAAAIGGLVDAYKLGGLEGARLESAIALIEVQMERTRQATAEDEREQRRLASAHTTVAVTAADAAAKTLIDADAKALAANKTELLARQERNAAQAFITANPHITASGIRAAIVAGVIPKLTGELAILTLQLRDTQAALAGLGSGTPEQGGDAINRFTTFKDKAKAFQDVQADTAKKAREQQILATGTEKQKLSILVQQEATARKIFGAGSAQAIEAHTAVIREQQAIAAASVREGKAHTTELGKQLNLQESIRDSLNAQYHAQLDASALAIKDRQDRRKEDRELAAANRILSSPNASAEFKAAAADKIALINVERQQRAADIADKSLTAGGSIINGKVFQGKPSGAGGVPVSAGGGGAPIVAPGAAGGATGGGGGGLTVQFVVNGHVISQEIIPDVIAALHNGLRQTNNAGGGRAP